MTMILDAFIDAALDTLKILPFLFGAFLALEAIEHYSTKYSDRILGKVGKAGPLVGALLGCIPQCGFSAAAANLYCAGLISLGTLLAVFLSTSDEAVLILLAHPGNGKTIMTLLFWKVIFGMAAGFLIDLFSRRQKSNRKMVFPFTRHADRKLSSKQLSTDEPAQQKRHIEEMCKTCGCHDEKGILRPALRHTGRLALWLFLFTFCLNLLLALVGVDRLAGLLGKDAFFQPFLAALLGLIPNCAASVLITELYLAGGLSFGSAIAGLSAGAGVGAAVLFRTNHSLRENLKILLLLYGCAVAAGCILGMF